MKLLGEEVTQLRTKIRIQAEQIAKQMLNASGDDEKAIKKAIDKIKYRGATR